MGGNLVAAAVIAFALAAVLTPLVIWAAHRLGVVSRPRADRWHQRPTALLGGIAIFLAFATTFSIYVPLTRPLLSVAAGAALMFALGLVDDLRPLSPQNKLLGQIVAACIPVIAGVVFRLPWGAPTSALVTVLWVVGVTNAMNLLDNMDGVAAGIAAISSAFLIAFGLQNGSVIQPLVAACLGGASLGFLLFNFKPARIFMGDCGSLVLGYVLSMTTALGEFQPKVGVLWTLLAPVALLGLPLFDTAFVSIQRLLHGRKISQGGRDHTSHRLVALGLSERSAALLLYGISAALGSLALLFHNLTGMTGLVMALISLGFLVSFARLLSLVETYPEAGKHQAAARWNSRGGTVLPSTFFNKKRVLEVLQDVVLIAGAFGGTLLLRNPALVSNSAAQLRSAQILPIVIIVHLAALFLFGVYRGVWRYASSHDFWRILGAITLGEITLSLFLPWYWPLQHPVTFLVLDWMLTLNLLGGARFLIKGLIDLFHAIPKPSSKRVFIYGAGRAGTSALREIRLNPSLDLQPIGFIDDAPEKLGCRMGGLRVLGGLQSLPRLVEQHQVTEVIIAMPSIPPQQLMQIQEILAAHGVSTRFFQPLFKEQSSETMAGSFSEGA